ncbi:amidohydrolase [Bacillus sp. SG-1]|uniref:amidohydrolase n=1 Tax=Bacillus sp. SG-1 TaxID=161544 RepID=UPI0001543B66|nr:amidohydrolase [Bacillus sp. SG-1]EDL66372.1 indole-3-acetyl-L-aspartic acid hydrolase [Bacillus sp. SG-1]
MVLEKINSYLNEQTPSLIQLRRELHRYPETAWTEYVTTYKIGRILENLGYELAVGRDAIKSEARLGFPSEEENEKHEKRAADARVPEEWLVKMKGGHTGLVAKIDTGKPGKHVAMRFDIDGLPINENKSEEHTPMKKSFVSEREGFMHSCGHDGHSVIGIGIAQFIKENIGSLSGRFTLLFQPAEEGGRGAKTMVEAGWLDDADLFLSGHIGIHDYPPGVVAASTTNFLATTKINVTYHGKSAHAGLQPNQGRNALLASAAASLHLNGITRHQDGATRINIGKLEAGSGRNIIADYARMEIETRGETTELNEYMVKEARRIIQASADMYAVRAETEVAGTAIASNCDTELINLIEEACADSSTVTEVIPSLPLGASEDVTFMIDRVQKRGGLATFLIFPSPLPAGHHHPSFDFDEKVIPCAIDALIRTVIQFGYKEESK